MRRYMIEKIALHVSDFSSRLTSNVKALYKYNFQIIFEDCLNKLLPAFRYCPIPPIEYPQLREELFCHCYYLRHLVDEQRFNNWPIRDPVEFLRACLAAWCFPLTKNDVKL